MNKLEKRAYICLLFVFIIIAGTGYFIFKLAADGEAWASYPANEHVYTNGLMTEGKIYDRNGTLLLENTESGVPVYSESESMRRANVHATGDIGNNIGTGANSVFAARMIGYDFINGVYSTSDDSQDIHLTVDAEANLAAYESLGNRNGTVGVYNYKTGEILTMVSTPTIDPANPSSDAESGAYVNKLLSSTVVPGSIFKVVTATAALETLPDIHSFEYYCPGFLEYGTSETDVVTCPYAHGQVDLEGALAVSCNGAFAILSNDVGSQTLEEYTDKANLTESYDIDGIKTAEGTFQFPTEDPLNLAWAGIGQYQDLVNPAAMMVYMGAIANGGSAAKPILLDVSGLEEIVPSGEVDLVNADTATTLGAYLANNVENYGTWLFPDLTVHGKTGTAEIAEGDETHAWFTGYLNDPDHPYAFIVLVENGGSGGEVATRVANDVLQELVYGE